MSDALEGETQWYRLRFPLAPQKGKGKSSIHTNESCQCASCSRRHPLCPVLTQTLPLILTANCWIFSSDLEDKQNLIMEVVPVDVSRKCCANPCGRAWGVVTLRSDRTMSNTKQTCSGLPLQLYSLKTQIADWIWYAFAAAAADELRLLLVQGGGVLATLSREKDFRL